VISIEIHVFVDEIFDLLLYSFLFRNLSTLSYSSSHDRISFSDVIGR